jgi:hypothetical protein
MLANSDTELPWARLIASLLLMVGLAWAQPGTACALRARFPGLEAVPASRIAYLGDAFAEARDPALRRLERCWIVAGARGIWALSPGGEEIPVPGIPGPEPGQVCQAVAVLPPGEGPCALDAPRLVYGRCSRIFALGLDGAHREWAPGWAGDAPGRRTVRDLALDRDGNVFVACFENRDILRIDLAGNVILHARLPAVPEGEAAGAGILAMVLDPASGDLLAGDAAGIWRVTCDGIAAPVLEAGPGHPFRPCHLALRGQDLVIADPHRREVLGFNLAFRQMTTLLGPAEGPGTRFGPIRILNPGLPAGACAALGGVGPLAVNPEGGCLLAVERGFAGFELPEAAKAPADPGRQRQGPTARQKALAHFRWFQLGIRNHKKQLRAEGRRAREEEARAAQARSLESTPARRFQGPGGGGRVRWGVVPVMAICLAGDPSAFHALAQNAHPLPWSLASMAARTYGSTRAPAGSYSASLDPTVAFGFPSGTLPGVDNLAQACALPGVAALGIPDCDTGSLAALRNQTHAVRTLQSRLLAGPAELGAGPCVPLNGSGATPEAFALVTQDQLAQFDQFSIGALSLYYRIGSGGFRLQSAGAGLLIGQAAAMPGLSNATQPGNVTLPVSLPAFILGELGNNLAAAGAYVVAGGGAYGEIAAEARVQKVRYQDWVDSQDPAAWNCAGTSASPAVPLGAAIPAQVPSPLPAMAGLLAKRAAGCPHLAQPGITLPGCDEAFLTRWQRQNATLGALFREKIACLSVRSEAGVQSSCPGLPLAGARDRKRAMAALALFAAETEVPGVTAGNLAYGFFGGFETLLALGNAAQEAGAPLAADGWYAAADAVFLSATVMFSEWLDLLGVANTARALEVRLTRESLAGSLAQLRRTAALYSPDEED